MAEHQQAHKSSESKSNIQKRAILPKQIPVSHPAAIIQRARINPKSLTPSDVLQLQQTIGNRAVGKLLSEIGLISSKAKQTQPVQMQTIPEEEKEPLQGKIIGTIQCQEIHEEEETLQGKFESGHEREICPSCIQRQEISEEEPLQTKMENNTGMPDNLKAGVESLSGIDMSDVRVHYNSSKPAEVGALAYTQGTEIHVAPGHERHLPHEAWHVVQQAQGRVKPTVQLKDVSVNDDVGLEREADVMSSRAMSHDIINEGVNQKILQRKSEYLQLPEKTIQRTAKISIQNTANTSETEEGISDAHDLTVKDINDNNHNNVLKFTRGDIPNQPIYNDETKKTEDRNRYKCAEPSALGRIMAAYPHKVGSNWLYDLKFTARAYITSPGFIGYKDPCAVCSQWVTMPDLTINHRIIKDNVKSIEEEQREAERIRSQKESKAKDMLYRYQSDNQRENPALAAIAHSDVVLSHEDSTITQRVEKLDLAHKAKAMITKHISQINESIELTRIKPSEEITNLLKLLSEVSKHLDDLIKQLEASKGIQKGIEDRLKQEQIQISTKWAAFRAKPAGSEKK